MNGIKTALLLGAMSGLFLLGGKAIGGERGMLIGLFLAIGMNFFSYFFSEKMALAMYHAQPVSPSENPGVWQRVGHKRQLAQEFRVTFVGADSVRFLPTGWVVMPDGGPTITLYANHGTAWRSVIIEPYGRIQ